ncbi:hypothetical protein Tco_0512117 [Tanacetum coccineum]
MLNRQNGRMILESVESGPLIWPSIVENGVTRPKKYSELSAKHFKLIVISRQQISFSKDYHLSNSLDETGIGVFKRYDEFDIVCYVRRGITHPLLAFGCNLISDPVSLSKLIITHTKPSKFQPQVSSFQSPRFWFHPYQSQQYSTHQSSTPLSITYPSNEYQSSIHHNIYSPSSSIPHLEYAPSVDQQSKFSQQESGLIVPVFQKGDDPIDAINHMMSFLTAAVTSHYPIPIKPVEEFIKP